VRALSRAEGIVVRGLVSGSSPASGGASPQLLPRRTEQTVRQRVIAREWVLHRYVPKPAALGLPFVSFVLARPFTEQARELSRRWAATPSCVLVWEAADRLLGVFWDASEGAAERGVSEATPVALVHDRFVIHADSREGTIPVYFDFEAGWDKFARLGAPLAYPHPLGSELSAAGVEHRPELSAREQAAVVRLLNRPFHHRGPPGAGGGTFLDHARERRCLSAGWVEPRYFLDPVAVHRWAAGFPDSVAFVQGDLLPDSRPSELFRDAMQLADVAPFLFVVSSGRVLIGTLARNAASRAPRPPARGRSVLGTLQRHLRNIRADRVPLGSITAIKQHLFIDLLPAATDRNEAG
jgi:hypothetical protein